MHTLTLVLSHTTINRPRTCLILAPKGAVQGMVTGIRSLCTGLGPAVFGALFQVRIWCLSMATTPTIHEQGYDHGHGNHDGEDGSKPHANALIASHCFPACCSLSNLRCFATVH